MLCAVLAALICALALPAAASAATFMVDTTGDQAKGSLGIDCLVEAEGCTLRAAIEESNASVGGFDRINFDENVFDGGATSTIALGSGLPTIVDPIAIEGRECSHGGIAGPCAGVKGPSSGIALIVEGADNVEIIGLAVTGAQIGIDVLDGSDGLRVKGSWLGVELDGTAGGNTTGIFVDPTSNEARIGGEAPGTGNVFANNSGDGLDIFGADASLILGNDFGVKPDGTTPAANGKDIEVTSTSTLEASETTIGQLQEGAAETPACDRGCNLISGAISNGIDLQGDGGSEAPSVQTTIVGNYIGLSVDGTEAVPNGESGVRVGAAPGTTIGGVLSENSNRIVGGQFGVFAGSLGVPAKELTVFGNVIGTDVTGATLSPPTTAVSVDSAGVAGEVEAAEVSQNLISMSGGIAIEQHGPGGFIDGNEIFGAGTAIKTYGSTSSLGNLIADNLVEGAEGNGILVENDENEIVGNAVLGSGAAAIRIQNSGGTPSTGNQVGGDAAEDENLISGSAGDAIEIVDTSGEPSENEVGRNRGAGNAGLFIDLAADGAGNPEEGPNGGIQPPIVLSAKQAEVSGGGALAGANIRVFRKASAEAGELKSFLGEATANGSGNWKLVYASSIPGGTIVAATQTNVEGGTSELTTATTVADPKPPQPPKPPPPPPKVDTTPPTTKISAGPNAKSHSTKARFKFSASESHSTFQCKLDGKPFKSCKSPKTYKGLKPGKHVFKVRATDPAGNVGKPVTRKFTVLG